MKIFNLNFVHGKADTYFKPTKPLSRSQILKPDDRYSMTVPSSIIAANQEASRVIAMEKSACVSKQRGMYTKYTPKQKATIENYSILHGTIAALRYFKAEFPDLKWLIVNIWKVAIIKKKRVVDVQNDEHLCSRIGGKEKRQAKYAAREK